MKGMVKLLVLSVILLGCRKSNQPADTPTTDIAVTNNSSSDTEIHDDLFYANQILYNDSYSKYFAPFVEKLANSTKNIYTEIYTRGGMTLVNYYKSFSQTQRTCADINSFCLNNNIDTTIMMDNRAEIFASWGVFMQRCPIFMDMSELRRQSIFSMVMNTLRDARFRQENATNILVVAYNNALLTMKPSLVSSSGVSGRLTTEEVMGCLGNTIAAVAGNSVQLIRDFVNVINGSNLGWSGIKSVARSFFNTAVSSNALLGAISFGVCIAWEYFF